MHQYSGKISKTSLRYRKTIIRICFFFISEMNKFYKDHNLKKSGEGPGLEAELVEDACPFISYLRSIRSLHELCTSRDLEDQE